MKKPRYVILEHDWPSRHWDFLLEMDGLLRAWRLLDEPISGTRLRAERNFDHRLHYLDFEGTLEGDRGSVIRWDFGTFEIIRYGSSELLAYLDGTRGFDHVEVFSDATYVWVRFESISD